MAPWLSTGPSGKHAAQHFQTHNHEACMRSPKAADVDSIKGENCLSGPPFLVVLLAAYGAFGQAFHTTLDVTVKS